MVYTVGEMARLLDVSASTLRYYDKEGLLPFVERSSGADGILPESALEGFAEYYSANPAEKVNRGNGFRGSDMDLASELIEIS